MNPNIAPLIKRTPMNEGTNYSFAIIKATHTAPHKGPPQPIKTQRKQAAKHGKR
jgi:hypothetical protein